MLLQFIDLFSFDAMGRMSQGHPFEPQHVFDSVLCMIPQATPRKQQKWHSKVPKFTLVQQNLTLTMALLQLLDADSVKVVGQELIFHRHSGHSRGSATWVEGY